ncbi:MAG: Hsp20/alpha crystallin family protein [Nitrososphaeraceae archaeon]
MIFHIEVDKKDKIKKSILDQSDDDIYLNILTPFYDVVESDITYELLFMIPGINKKNLKIIVSNRFIRLIGKQSYIKENLKGLYQVSRKFQMTISIPKTNINCIGAEINNGVLIISLPKWIDDFENQGKVIQLNVD